MLGTPAYMAPEQAFPDLAEVSPRSDLYALGGVLYQMLTGTTMQILAAHARGDSPRPIRQVRPDLDMASSWPAVRRMGVFTSWRSSPASSNLCGRPMGYRSPAWPGRLTANAWSLVATNRRWCTMSPRVRWKRLFESGVSAAAFSPDGKVLVLVAGEDRLVGLDGQHPPAGLVQGLDG